MSDNIVILRVSRDASANYGDATFHPLGNTGTFGASAERTRLGMSYQLVLEYEDSSFYRNDVLALGVAD